ncbi:MAG: YbhB/YbcL family Raf kinase inhibitor-like protein [Candidatus Aramenus sp.]|jgi:Raf kinase inhibitor-like YbhB/YbcL family protein|nr:YbhB/YbcL family Raf kinase inhibitor-like protein [Candidatus Aramenus sp.]
MEVKSVFKNGEPIPTKYTCDGENVSPPLQWDKVENAKTYAVIVEDPDAPGGTFYHWVIYNLKVNSLPDGVKRRSELGIQGLNDFGEVGYGGPCPPRTHGPHRYYFNVYALDIELPAKRDVTAEKLKEMMNGHVIDRGSIMGTYKRK